MRLCVYWECIVLLFLYHLKLFIIMYYFCNKKNLFKIPSHSVENGLEGSKSSQSRAEGHEFERSSGGRISRT